MAAPSAGARSGIVRSVPGAPEPHCYRRTELLVRRALSIALILIVAFAAALLAGFWGAARLAPERVRRVAEQQLSRVLHGQVTLAHLEIARSSRMPWLWLEAKGARAVLRDDVTLLAGHVRARLDPLSLALGRLGLADLRLEDVIVMFPPHDDGKPKRDHVSRILRPIELTGEFLRDHPCAIPDLEVEGLTVLVTRDDQLDVLFEAGEGALSCIGLGRDHARARLAALARRGDGIFPASFTLSVSRDSAAADLVLRSVPLTPLLGVLGIDVELGGTVSGTARLEAPAEGPYRLDVALTGKEVEGPIPGASREAEPWLVLDLPAPKLSGRLTATSTRLSLERSELTDGALKLGASGELTVPARATSASRLALSLGEIDVKEAPRLLAQLPETPRREALRALSRVEAGRFAELRVELKGTLEQLADLGRRSVLSQPGALHLAASLEGATVRLGESDRASAVDAKLDFSGDRLSLAVSRGTFHARPLPQLALTLDGIRNVRSFEEFNCREPRPQPPLAGLPRLRDWLGEERTDPEERKATDWQRIALELDWVSHPTLVCGLEQTSGEIVPMPEGFRIRVAHGVWAGLPVEGEGRWRRASTEPERQAAMTLAAKLGPPFEAMSLDPPAQPWLSGRFTLEATRLGRWHVRGASGRITANGPRLDLPGTTLRLAPGGAIEGRIGIDLGVADTLPFSAEAQFAGVDLLDLWRAADFERGALGGTLYGGGAIEGQLRSGLNPLGDARGLLALHARNGQIHRRIPLMVALALASERFNPFGNREELPYQAIDAVARVKKGKLVFDNVQLHAETVRMGATGKGGVIEPYKLEAVVGMFFFPGLDSLIDRVPILNRVILGRNGNFVGAYFAITGQWGAPDASLIPIQTIATGPTGFITEGIPGFVIGGIKRIQSVILPSEEAKAPAGEDRAGS
jgi:hypothetical protein